MNNKGFTMVELLAVIALLSILSGTAILAVTRYISNAQKKTYKNYESNLKGGAINYLTAHTELSTSTNLKIYANDLLKEGYIDTLTDPINKGKTCNNSNKSKDSYIIVTGKRETPTAYNLSFTYKVCLICDSYKSKGC